jgi:hypothetical protein
MTLNMTIIKAAKAQIREARENGELEDFDIDTPAEREIIDEAALHEVKCSNAKNRHNREYDWDAMSTCQRDDQKLARREFRKVKRAFSEEQREAAVENDECRIEWNYPAGTLVTIKEPTRAQPFGWSLERLGLTHGDTGIVCDTEDSEWRGRQRGRSVTVVGPQGFQEWDAAWLTVEGE